MVDAQRRRGNCLPDAAAVQLAGRVDIPSLGEEAPRVDGRYSVDERRTGIRRGRTIGRSAGG